VKRRDFSRREAEIIQKKTVSARATVQIAQLLPGKTMSPRQSAEKVENFRKLAGSSGIMCYNEGAEALCNTFYTIFRTITAA
jgi:hypothetical protein